MKCNRRSALREEISHDWNNLNLAAQILVCIGGFVFMATIFLAFYKIRDDSLYRAIEVVFRSCLASIFGFILSSNIKNSNKNTISKSTYDKDEEASITQEKDACIISVNYREGNSIQLIIAFSICMICAICILAIYVYDLRQDIPSITMFRDLMCSSIGFLLGESRIKNE